MSWQRRLLELAAAGGALSAAGCQFLGGGSCVNASPDPCLCGHAQEHPRYCAAVEACRDHGGSWSEDDTPPPGVDAGSGPYGHCEGYPLDAGPDAPRDASSDAPRD